jgi:hypothetical protein
VKYGPAEEQSLTPEIPGFALELGLENAVIHPSRRRERLPLRDSNETK